jgi:hypothetical protein
MHNDAVGYQTVIPQLIADIWMHVMSANVPGWMGSMPVSNLTPGVSPGGLPEGTSLLKLGQGNSGPWVEAAAKEPYIAQDRIRSDGFNSRWNARLLYMLDVMVLGLHTTLKDISGADVAGALDVDHYFTTAPQVGDYTVAGAMDQVATIHSMNTVTVPLMDQNGNAMWLGTVVGNMIQYNNIVYGTYATTMPAWLMHNLNAVNTYKTAPDSDDMFSVRMRVTATKLMSGGKLGTKTPSESKEETSDARKSITTVTSTIISKPMGGSLGAHSPADGAPTVPTTSVTGAPLQS